MQNVTVLEPNFFRAFVHAFGIIFAAIAVAFFFERIHTGQWWSISYLGSLAIPLFLMPAFCCLAFVPRRIEWSNTEFRIFSKFWKSKTTTFLWSDLVAYGRGRGTFMIQFSGRSAFQIYSSAFDRKTWRTFTDFLASTFPEKKAKFWIGARSLR